MSGLGRAIAAVALMAALLPATGCTELLDSGNGMPPAGAAYPGKPPAGAAKGKGKAPRGLPAAESARIQRELRGIGRELDGVAMPDDKAFGEAEQALY